MVIVSAFYSAMLAHLHAGYLAMTLVHVFYLLSFSAQRSWLSLHGRGFEHIFLGLGNLNH